MTLDAFVRAFDALPDGTFKASADGRRFVVVKSAKGAIQKLVADDLNGSERISLNLYRLSKGPVLKPCERPAAQVIALVKALKPD